jgi:hypothetical protein
VNAALQATRELNGTADQSEQRVVAATADILTGVKVRAVLTDDDRAGVDFLASEALDAESLGA